jgi:hypothetical protein
LYLAFMLHSCHDKGKLVRVPGFDPGLEQPSAAEGIIRPSRVQHPRGYILYVF